MIITVKGGLIMDIMSNIEIDVLTVDFDRGSVHEDVPLIPLSINYHNEELASCERLYPIIDPQEIMKLYDYIENKLNI